MMYIPTIEANDLCSGKIFSECSTLFTLQPRTTVGETFKSLNNIRDSGQASPELLQTLEDIDDLSPEDQVDAYLAIASDESGQLSDNVTKLNKSNSAAVSARIGAVRGLATGETSSVAMMNRDGSLINEYVIHQGGSAGDDDFTRFGVYGRFDYDNGDVDATLNQAGYDFDGYGITVGGDYTFNKSYLVGLSLGFPFYENDFDTENTKTDIDGVIVTGYFSYFVDAWYIDGVISYSALELDMQRGINIAGDTTIVKADNVGSDITSVSVGGGYLFNYNLWALNAEGMLQYTTSTTDGYKEEVVKGNDDLALTVDKVDDLSSTQLIVGGTASYPFSSTVGVIQPYFRGYMHYEFEDDSNTIVTRIAGDTGSTILPVLTDEPDSFYGTAHIGVSGIFMNNLRGYGEVGTLLGLDNTSAYSISVGVNLDF